VIRSAAMRRIPLMLGLLAGCRAVRPPNPLDTAAQAAPASGLHAVVLEIDKLE